MPETNGSRSRARIVLHLVDRTTGGVPVAVRGYIANSPEGFVHIVASPHAAGAPAAVWGEGDALAVTRHLAWDTSNPWRALRSLRALVSQVRPDVVHAHSSFPGVYARLVGRGAARLVYTPHCFAFERRDIGRTTRAVYRGIERVLRRRADILAAGGPGEALAAASIGYQQERVRVVPNVPSVQRVASVGLVRATSSETVTIGMLGRWAPQKDPGAFVSAARDLRAALPGVNVRAKWIGGGAGVEAAPDDIEVTGWRTPEGVAAELADLDVYVHTAAWEAAVAIAVLDAIACGLPVLARPIPAMPELPPSLRWDLGMPGLVDAVRGRDLARWSEANRRQWEAYLDGRFTRPAQREALQQAWA